jgi:YVTN family beta-propeller protein
VYATESSYQTTNVLDAFNKSYINLAINEALAAGENTQTASLRPQDKGIKIGGNPYGIAVNSDNNIIYVIDKFYKKISFIDGDTDRIIKTVTIPNNRPTNFKYNISDISSAIAVDQRFNLIYITNSGSNTVSAIDGSDGNTVTNITVDGSPRALAVESNTSRIHVVTNNNIQTKNESTLASRVYTINGFFNRVEAEHTTTIDNEFLTAIDIHYGPSDRAVYVTGQGEGENDNNTVYEPERHLKFDQVKNKAITWALQRIQSITISMSHMSLIQAGYLFLTIIL